MKRTVLGMVLAALVVTFVTPALAQVEPRAEAQRRVVYDMDVEIIEGVTLKAPAVPLVSKGPKPTHRNLIQVRKSFAPELLASVAKL
jgi:hypothetical protein